MSDVIRPGYHNATTSRAQKQGTSPRAQKRPKFENCALPSVHHDADRENAQKPGKRATQAGNAQPGEADAEKVKREDEQIVQIEQKHRLEFVQNVETWDNPKKVLTYGITHVRMQLSIGVNPNDRPGDSPGESEGETPARRPD